jgi:hypothetical protein
MTMKTTARVQACSRPAVRTGVDAIVPILDAVSDSIETETESYADPYFDPHFDAEDNYDPPGWWTWNDEEGQWEYC